MARKAPLPIEVNVSRSFQLHLQRTTLVFLRSGRSIIELSNWFPLGALPEELIAYRKNAADFLVYLCRSGRAIERTDLPRFNYETTDEVLAEWINDPSLIPAFPEKEVPLARTPLGIPVRRAVWQTVQAKNNADKRRRPMVLVDDDEQMAA